MSNFGINDTDVHLRLKMQWTTGEKYDTPDNNSPQK